MKKPTPVSRFAAVTSLTVLLVTGCGGKQSVASKSAAAFNEAQRKAAPPGEAAHRDHAEPSESLTTTTGHAEMSEMEHPATPGMDHSKMAGMGHARGDMRHGKAPHGQHGQTQSGGSPTPMEHGAMQHGMQHGETTQGARMAEVRPVEARPGQAASTLEPDLLDAPVPTSVSDAARSAEMAQMMTSPGYMVMGSSGMGDMPDMGLPRNTLLMGSHKGQAEGPFGSIFMGGMFTILKVRENLRNDEDPGWYDHPAGTVASPVGAAAPVQQPSKPHEHHSSMRPAAPVGEFDVVRASACSTPLPGRR